jgi:hypothetical protein
MIGVGVNIITGMKIKFTSELTNCMKASKQERATLLSEGYLSSLSSSEQGGTACIWARMVVSCLGYCPLYGMRVEFSEDDCKERMR